MAVVLAFGTFAALDIGMAIANLEPMVLYSGAAVVVLVYSLFRWGSGRDIVVGLAVMLIGFAASVLTDDTGLTDIIGGAAVLLFAAALGVAVRYRSTAREQLIERAKLTERELLARELHDTVAHHVSAIAIQAQAGLFLVRSGSSDGATDALEIIDREAAQTLAEMRTMVGALRDRGGAAEGGHAAWPRQAADGGEAVALARKLRPDVCLFDIRMPNVDGIEATRLLAGPEVSHPIAVVVITTFDRRRASHQPKHSQVPRRQPHDQARSAKPR